MRDVIDNTGTVLNHIVYDSFGQVTSETDPTFDFRFGYTGRELDEETGMMYYRARYYDPLAGRFVNEDPLGFGAGDVNVYRYVFNSPTNYTDPSGQIVISGPVIIGTIITTIVVTAAADAWFLDGGNTPQNCEDLELDLDNSANRALAELVLGLGVDNLLVLCQSTFDGLIF